MAEKVIKFSYLEDSVIIDIVGENDVLGGLLILVVFLEWKMVHRMAPGCVSWKK